MSCDSIQRSQSLDIVFYITEIASNQAVFLFVAKSSCKYVVSSPDGPHPLQEEARSCDYMEQFLADGTW